jgi:hypothetical protein
MLGGFIRAKAVALEGLGHDVEALSALDAAATRAQQSGDTGLVVASRCLAVPIALRQGDAAGAKTRLAEGLASLSASARITSEPARACAMARAELALVEKNSAAAQEALLALLNEPKMPLQHRASALVLRARAALLTNNAAAALADADAALALARQMQGQRKFSFRTAAALAVRGDALAAGSDIAAAQKVYAEAMVQFEGATDAGHPQRVGVKEKLVAR